MNARYLAILLVSVSVFALDACKLDQKPNARNTAAVADTGEPTVQGNLANLATPAPAPAQVAYGPESSPASDSYAPAERAHSFDRAVYRHAPSYAFRYQNEAPLAWNTPDGYSMYAERVDNGYRDSYFAPGTSRPYFVRDPQYGYGYGPDGTLSAVYNGAGALMDISRLERVAANAGAYYVRARELRRYGANDSYRAAVSESYWAQQAPDFYAEQQRWISAPDRQSSWRDWRRFHSRDIATYDVQSFHDNGRHLGWFKHDRVADQPVWDGDRSDEKAFRHEAKRDEKEFKHAEKDREHDRGNGHSEGGDKGHGHGDD